MDLARLKEQTRAHITRVIAENVPEIVESMLALAKKAEKEDVRFRAGKWALEEFSDRSKTPQALPQTSVQIINAIPFERTAYEGKKALPTIKIDNLEVAVPKKLREVTPEPGTASTKNLYGVTKPVEPSEAKVPVLPKRNG